jgi:hypothetical protein
MTLFEPHVAKFEALDRKLPRADVAAQLGQSPAAPTVKPRRRRLSLKKPEGFTRNHPEPGPSGFDWPLND